uniref:restriction endonuclease n=1 Tax=Clostridium sp. NkU-1 TaxID=1095009 RepID=UPI0006CF4CE0
MLFLALVSLFLCECKNYAGKVNVTYVGKFYSLLKTSNCKMGILVAWEGVTRRGTWSDSLGLIKKIALKDDTYIIVIDKNDFDRIIAKETHIFEIIYSKYIAMKNEIDYSNYISKHENEDKFII